MKSKRQEEILALIQEQNIETQNQLIEALRKRGVKSTQATLSRDIRELRLVKELSPDGGYRYTVPVREDSGDQLDRLRKIFRECVVSFDTRRTSLSSTHCPASPTPRRPCSTIWMFRISSGRSPGTIPRSLPCAMSVRRWTSVGKSRLCCNAQNTPH